MEKRLDYLDQMKGIAIWLMVIGHVMLFSFKVSDTSAEQMLGIFHMPIFFFVSGYLAYRVIPDLKNMFSRLRHKFMALALPLASAVIIRHTFKPADWNWLVTDFWWFLYILLIITCFFVVYEWIIGRVENKWVYVGLWILPYSVLIVLKLKQILPPPFLGHAVIDHLVAYYRYYLLGYMACRFSRFDQFLKYNKVVYVIALFSFVLDWMMFECHNMLLIFAGGIGAIVVLQSFLIGQKDSKSPLMNLFSYLGRKSLGIYMFNNFFIAGVSSYFNPLMAGENAFVWQLLLATMLSVPAIACCLFVTSLIEHNAYLNYIIFGRKV